jgi:hypothetical protein
MQKYLFHNFLETNLTYFICKEYWQTKMEYFFESNKIENPKAYLTTTFANGEDFRNGNPMVNYFVPELNKAFRIIQEEPDNENADIAAWIDDFEMNENRIIEELVISIHHTPETEQVAFDLISKWLVSNLPKQKMERYIELKLELVDLHLRD